MQGKPVPELALPGWVFKEFSTHDVGGERMVTVRARRGMEVEHLVSWRLCDDNPLARDHSLKALAVAVCQFEANPAAYFHAQYAYAQSRNRPEKI